MPNIFSIAIDGPAGSGKSTLAKALSRALHAMYLDTGAMYRAFGLAALRAGADTHDCAGLAGQVDISVEYANGEQRIFVNGEDVTGDIRTPEVSAAASDVSTCPEVRARMVALQRQIARGHSVVMDGRDIGTHVLPDATLKIFLTASPEVRARRRYLEMQEKGQAADYDEVLKDLQARDLQDTRRAASPLRPAEDAVRLDNSGMGLEETIDTLMRLAAGRGIVPPAEE